MNHSNLFVHDYFYDGGPDTFEYFLPCEGVADEHSRLFGDWIRRFTEKSGSGATTELNAYLDEIEFPEIVPLTSRIRGLLPSSVVVHQEHVWLLCKRPDSLEKRSAHGNMVLVPPPNSKLELSHQEDGENPRGVDHLLRCFAGMKADIPPTSGFVPAESMLTVAHDPTNFAWKNVGSWEGSTLIYLPGNGDAVLLDKYGRFGLWDHGMQETDDEAVILLGGLAEFINYVLGEIGLSQ